MQRLQSGDNGELHLGPERTMASHVLRLPGEWLNIVLSRSLSRNMLDICCGSVLSPFGHTLTPTLTLGLQAPGAGQVVLCGRRQARMSSVRQCGRRRARG